VSLDLDTPGKPTDKIEAKLWMNPDSVKSYDFLNSF